MKDVFAIIVTRPTDRFLDRLIVDSSGCWEHANQPWRNGYRYMALGKMRLRAHRVMYRWLRGPIPDGMTLDHLCRNRGCLNPWHLEVVTVAENNRRGEGVSAINTRKDRCPQGHLYEGANLYIAPTGRRGCRACRKAAVDRYVGRTA